MQLCYFCVRKEVIFRFIPKPLLMRYLLLFCFCVQWVFSQSINQLDAQGKKHGIWKGTYANTGRPRYEGTFEHGKEVGTFRFFDNTKEGAVIATREFNPKDNSCYTIVYTPKGNKVSEGKLVNRLEEGEWKFYHEDSPQIMTLEFYVKGKLNGTRKVFYKSGALAEECGYKNGLREGVYRKITEQGLVLEESNYKNGEYDGPAVFRTAENKIAARGTFVKGKKEGIWEVLEKGKLVKKDMGKQKVRKFVKKPITREEDRE